MSYKEKASCSKNKHYSTMEKKVFLQILEEYKHVVEVKKNNSATLKEKDVAWNEICTKFNESTLIFQERNIQQLKKLWANLKQSQREALTKEKQARMATGEGPQETEANIDPDISNIAPHLMKTAPVLFTSNMTEAEINNQRELAFDIVSSHHNMDILDIENDECVIEDINESTSFQGTSTTAKTNNKGSTIAPTTCNLSKIVSNMSKTENIETISKMKRKRKESLEFLDTEENLKVERIKRIMDEEAKLAQIKLKHEETMIHIKEEHLKEI